jgi:RNA polymerase subunit RPABC4/transcription elongation factor Spt4
LPGRKRWWDTDEAQQALAQLRSAMVGWKEAGYDVSELEQYLASPDMTREGVEERVQAVLALITSRMRTTATHSFPPVCPRCSAQLTSKERICPACSAELYKRERVAPYVNCPECKSRARPEDSKCPVCGRRLKPWSLFS